MLNAMLNVIIEGLYDKQYVQTHAEGFPHLEESIMRLHTGGDGAICGIPAATLREVARTYARAERRSSSGAWACRSIPRHRQCPLSDLARHDLGQIGRPERACIPCAPENVQGPSDAGLIPMLFPDYTTGGGALRSEASSRALWDATLDPKQGLTVVEIMDAIHAARSTACTSWVRTRRCPTPTPMMRARRSRTRASRRAGPLPHRDRRLCRRDPACLGLAREGRAP